MAYVKSEIADDIETLVIFAMAYFKVMEEEDVGSINQNAKRSAERVEAWLATTRDGLV